MNKLIDCFVPQGLEEETDKNVQALDALDIVNDITIVETSMRESDTVRMMAEIAKTPYTLFFLKSQYIRMGFLALERMVQVAEMTGAGIAEVPDPSGLFLSQGAAEPGTCVAIALEGRRALPVEVQALTIDSSAPNPRRVVHGLDSSRVAMVLAILERRAGISTSKLDVYVSTVGGVRFTEPAADLAIAVAVAGSMQHFSVPRTVAAVGELSLAGEIRPVVQAAQRRSEAARLGYQQVVDDRSKTLRAALGDVRSRSTQRRREDEIPAF